MADFGFREACAVNNVQDFLSFYSNKMNALPNKSELLVDGICQNPER